MEIREISWVIGHHLVARGAVQRCVHRARRSLRHQEEGPSPPLALRRAKCLPCAPPPRLRDALESAQRARVEDGEEGLDGILVAHARRGDRAHAHALGHHLLALGRRREQWLSPSRHRLRGREVVGHVEHPAQLVRSLALEVRKDGPGAGNLRGRRIEENGSSVGRKELSQGRPAAVRRQPSILAEEAGCQHEARAACGHAERPDVLAIFDQMPQSA